MWNLVKIFVLYKVVNNPLTVLVCTGLIVALLLLAGAFIKFKNGFFSWLCYFAVLAVPMSYIVMVTLAVVDPPEDLKLSKPMTLTYKEIKGDCIVAKKGFRREVSYKLLGIDTIKTQQRLDDVKDLIGHHSKDNTITYKTSELYEGIILYDEEGNDLNHMMIERGYVRNAFVSPGQYERAADVARANRAGIWATTVSCAPSAYTLFKKVIFFSSFTLIFSLLGPFCRLNFGQWQKL